MALYDTKVKINSRVRNRFVWTIPAVTLLLNRVPGALVIVPSNVNHGHWKGTLKANFDVYKQEKH